MNTTVLRTFYRSFIESVLTLSFMAWFGGLNVRNRNKLSKIVNVSSKIVGERMSGLTELYESRVREKCARITADTSHVLACNYQLLPSGKRYRVPLYKTVRAKSSFIPMSIQFTNKLK